jgi:hypothetical protein
MPLGCRNSIAAKCRRGQGRRELCGTIRRPDFLISLEVRHGSRAHLMIGPTTIIHNFENPSERSSEVYVCPHNFHGDMQCLDLVSLGPQPCHSRWRPRALPWRSTCVVAEQASALAAWQPGRMSAHPAWAVEPRSGAPKRASVAKISPDGVMHSLPRGMRSFHKARCVAAEGSTMAITTGALAAEPDLSRG